MLELKRIIFAINKRKLLPNGLLQVNVLQQYTTTELSDIGAPPVSFECAMLLNTKSLNKMQ